MNEWLKEFLEEERDQNQAFRAEVCDRLTTIETWIHTETELKKNRAKLWSTVFAVIGALGTIVGLALSWLSL